VHRLITVLDNPAPGTEDLAYVLLADAAGIARPHLRGWEQRRRRARLAALRHTAAEGDAAMILSTGRKAIEQVSRLTGTDPRNSETPYQRAQRGFTPGPP
jgi:hypothetical protein